MTPLTRLWRWLMSHIAVVVKFGERVVDAVLDLDVQPAPTASITVVSPTGPIYAGDEVVVRVDLTPADAGGLVDSFTVDGAPVPVNPDGTFSFAAALPAEPAAA